MFIKIFTAFIITERLIELYIAKKNTIYLESIGGFEIGRKHYRYIVLLHILFIFSFYVESFNKIQLPLYWYIPFTIFIIAQIFRFWIIYSLGRFWNTRIYVLPKSKPIKKGPYKYMKHPNYLIVMIEMITIPLIFGAYYTLLIFPILNLIILTIRIKLEEEALSKIIKYNVEMKGIPRFFPKK